MMAVYLASMTLNMKARFKLFNFLQYFAVGVIGPYLVVFLSQKAFSGAQIGLILGVLPVGGLVFQPLWGLLSDILSKRRLLMLVALLGLIVASLGLGFSASFSGVFLWAIVFSVMRAPISSIITAMILDYLEEINDIDSYSLIRLWGSVGFGVATLVIGSLFLDRILVYFPWIAAGVFLSLAVLSQFLPEKGHGFTYTGVKELGGLIKNPGFAFYLAGSMFIGASFGIYNNYLTLFLQSMEASSWLIGVIMSIQAFVEIPVMMAVPFLLRKYSSRRIILLGALILPLRWLLYFLIYQPGWILPIQLVHGLPVIAFFVVSVAFVDRLVDTKFRATGQALYSTVLMGIGSGLGVMIAGRVIDSYGIRQIWLVNIVLGLLGLLILTILFSQMNLRQGEETPDRPV